MLIGGVVTPATSLILTHPWFSLDSTTGGGLSYQTWFIPVNCPAWAALVLFVAVAACGISIVVGAALQSSGERSRERRGSVIALVAAAAGIAATFSGCIVGGLLSVIGGASGPARKPSARAGPPV